MISRPYLLIILLCCFLAASCIEARSDSNAESQTASISGAGRQAGKGSRGALKVTSGPSILSRQEWGAYPPSGEMKKLRPSYITIHHTATLQKKGISLEQKMKDLQIFSQSPDEVSPGKFRQAWPDIPYHFYIDCNGRIAEGRELRYVGDTNTDYDPAGHILVVLEGNFEIEKPGAEQMKSLYQLVGWLAREWKIDPARIKGHRDYAETQCPGKNLEPEIVKLQEYVRKSLVKME